MTELKFDRLAVSIASIGVGAALTIGYLLIPRKSPEPNPFSFDSREEPEPFVTDKNKRDSVLKNGYSRKKLSLIGNDFDVIIIGSGIGSLVTAGLLSRAGKKVIILEQHDQAGGCCHTFTEKGFEFDTGIHYVGEMRNNTAFRFLLDQLSNGHLGWADVADDFDTVVLVDSEGTSSDSFDKLHRVLETGEKLPSRWIPYMSSRDETIASLVAAFPNEKAAIEKYFQVIESTRSSMRGFVALKFMPSWLGRFLVKTGLVYWFTDYFKYAKQSVSQVLKSITSNMTLRAVLAYNFGDYGTIPKNAPFSLHASLQNHFLRGVSYPIGGSSEIGYHLIQTITRSGGAVFVRAEVEKIITNEDGTCAIGVQMKRDQNVITAPLIISDAGLINTAKLLPSPAAARLKPMLRHVKSGTGGLSVYVGLKGSAQELQLEGKHYWAMWTKNGQEDLDEITEKYLQRPRGEITSGPVPLLFISFPSAKDPLWESKHPGKSTATIVTFANYEWFREWENERVMHRGKEYEELKVALGQLIWKQTVALFPQLKDKVEYFDIGTPVTNKYYLAANAGEMYGCDHTLSRFTPEAAVDLRPETNIKNLYLTGQDVFSCGFAGASFGGLLCASAILRRNLYEDLIELKKKSPPSIRK